MGSIPIAGSNFAMNEEINEFVNRWAMRFGGTVRNALSVYNVAKRERDNRLNCNVSVWDYAVYYLPGIGK
jgi:hypothetical protein